MIPRESPPHNLFAGTETLSLSVYDPIAICVIVGDRPTIWVKGWS